MTADVAVIFVSMMAVGVLGFLGGWMLASKYTYRRACREMQTQKRDEKGRFTKEERLA